MRYNIGSISLFIKEIPKKYSRDSQSSQMLDMIREGIVFDFGFYYGSQLGDPDIIMRSVVSGGKNNYTSMYKTLSRIYEKKMTDLLAKYE